MKLTNFLLENVVFKRRFKIYYLFLRRNATIYALSSGLGKSGVAVVRISGNNSSHVVSSMTNFKSFPKPRTAYLRTVFDPITKEPLDKGLLLWFPGPKSFTGEDMCELQIHGSRAVIQALMTALSKISDFRPAEPGEFTKRAFYAGKFDLTEVEGLSDLIDAETELQRKQALFQMEGCLGKIYFKWRETILQNLAFTEAFIDFSEDENIEDNILSKVEKNLENLKNCIQEHLNDYRKGEILRDGIKTVIIGAPNVGKSSLLNIFCQRPAAIVTEIAGTTRDVVESTLNINGYPVLIADTAGIRKDQAADIVETEGIRRSINEATNAHLLLLLLDAREIFKNSVLHDSLNTNFLLSYIEQYQKSLGIDKILSYIRCIIIINKWDLINCKQKQFLKQNLNNSKDLAVISCRTHDGISDLMKLMAENFQQLCGVPNEENPACSRARHRHHLTECLNNLNEFLNMLQKEDREENIVLAAENLRSAAWHLGMITGLVATDEILSVIFKNFCIGK